MMLGGWEQLEHISSGLQAVVPLDDFKPHIKFDKKCWCRPEYDEYADMIVHNSLDGRESYENGRKPT